MDKKTKEMIEDIRSTPNSFLTREACLELFETIEQQQEKLDFWKSYGEELLKVEKIHIKQLQEKDEEIERLKKLFKNIQCYEAYSWNNDRQFIHSRIDEALNKTQ